MKVELTYFKDTGKYYTNGTFEYDGPGWALGQHVREMLANGKLPGLMEGVPDFHIHVGGEEVVPVLIVNPRALGVFVVPGREGE